MKLVAILAMALVAIDCALMAAGQREQTLFSKSHAWLWWIAAVGWFGNAVVFCNATVLVP
jgi:hypothetical protein